MREKLMKKKWIDPDDAPALTGEDFRRPGARFRIGGKIVAPEVGRQAFGVALRGKKTRINIHIDDDIIAYFKERAGPRGYQTLINSALRLQIAEDKASSGTPPHQQQRDELTRILQELSRQVSLIEAQVASMTLTNANGSWRFSQEGIVPINNYASNLLKNETMLYNS